MRPRREDRYIGSGTTVTIDLTAGMALTEVKAESKADVHALLWRKIEAIDPSMRGAEQLVLEMLGWMYSAFPGAGGPVPSGSGVVGDRLARAFALHQAANAIERQVDTLRSVAAVFDHNESLPTNELWPE